MFQQKQMFKNMENEKQKLILVPEQWFKSLLKDAEDFEQAQEKWEYGKSAVNDNIHFKAVSLMGYAKSADSILKHNERV